VTGTWNKYLETKQALKLVSCDGTIGGCGWWNGLAAIKARGHLGDGGGTQDKLNKILAWQSSTRGCKWKWTARIVTDGSRVFFFFWHEQRLLPATTATRKRGRTRTPIWFLAGEFMTHKPYQPVGINCTQVLPLSTIFMVPMEQFGEYICRGTIM
jgi:hypothetical protein